MKSIYIAQNQTHSASVGFTVCTVNDVCPEIPVKKTTTKKKNRVKMTKPGVAFFIRRNSEKQNINCLNYMI